MGDDDGPFLTGGGGGGGSSSVSGLTFAVDSRGTSLQRLDTCGELPRILSLCDRRRVTAREERRTTVNFDRFSLLRRQVSGVFYIPYRTRPPEQVFLLVALF